MVIPGSSPYVALSSSERAWEKRLRDTVLAESNYWQQPSVLSQHKEDVIRDLLYRTRVMPVADRFSVSGDVIRKCHLALMLAGWEVTPPSLELLAGGIVMVASQGDDGWLVSHDEAAYIARYGPERVDERAKLWVGAVIPGHWRVRKYLEVAISNILARLHQHAGAGRNNALNAAAYAMGRLCGNELLQLDQGLARGILQAEGEALGLPLGEIRACIKSGMEAGLENPNDWMPDDAPKPTKQRTKRNYQVVWD